MYMHNQYADIPLAWQAIHDMRDEEVSVRNHAVRMLGQLLEVVQEHAGCEGGAATALAGGGHVGMQMIGTAQGAGADMWEVYLDVIYPALRKNLSTRSRDLRHEAFRLLMLAGRLFGDFHADLGLLTHATDPEQDISLNLVHIQMHRRVKALVAIQRVVAGGGLSAATLRYILMPLIWWAMVAPSADDRSLIPQPSTLLGSSLNHQPPSPHPHPHLHPPTIHPEPSTIKSEAWWHGCAAVARRLACQSRPYCLL